MEKEYLYVGHYIDKNGFYILKIGTTNNLKRRAQEHTRNYKRSPNYTMPANGEFIYDWWCTLSKYNTHRYEDKNIDWWKTLGFGEYVRNDRFYCPVKPDFVQIAIRKTYQIAL